MTHLYRLTFFFSREMLCVGSNSLAVHVLATVGVAGQCACTDKVWLCRPNGCHTVKLVSDYPMRKLLVL